MTEENFVDNAEVILAVRGYKTLDIQKKKNLMDYTVSSQKSDDKILIRVIIETLSKTGYVGVDSVKEMNDLLEKRNYDKGILVGKRFTEAAKNEMKLDKIEMISDARKPYFKPITLFSVINEYIQKLCKAKCGQIPLKDSDCKGHPDGHYSCDVRLTSDNADFHFQRGWTMFLEKDLMTLLAIEKSTN
ncbi:MAG: restriction endonuclease [Candidatus Heimdallarchaeota archaeon]|nr:restriction endonuclease [Candidatus Heimdallarchaeota archaeon]